MEIKIVQESISLDELKNIAKNQFGNLVKAVVDIERGVIAVGGELHSDEEVLLSENGSRREYTWGINLYPENFGGDWIEFDSMINIKPQHGNRSRGVDSPEIQEKIKSIINKLVK